MERERDIHRLDKINRLLKEEVGKIILKELDLDRNALVTITQVKTSSDLAHATIFFSTLAKTQEKETLAALEKGVYEIQHILNRKLRMRPVPKIRFAPDASVDVEHRLYDILSNPHDDSKEIRA
ncbi:30S ribosome-binding factor RbfA [Candidatus Azambacteria bacterium]|nr:30S ribosome-binding factor RbfA [Candidatus Azambacteria bacterium]MBI3685000.1 30S ribosome-binding factor RbfA [Candidatus Azambacteria bacterium]